MVPLLVVVFGVIYSLNPDSFVINNTSNSVMEKEVIKQFMEELCKNSSAMESTVIKERSCNFKYKANYHTTMGRRKIIHTTSSIHLQFMGYENGKIKISYLFNYSYHSAAKKRDSGIIELDTSFISDDDGEVFIRAIPYASYLNKPILQIREQNPEHFGKSENPNKILHLLTAGILNLETGGSATFGRDWSYHEIISDSTYIKDLKKYYDNGVPSFKSLRERLSFFIYFSGISLLTVGFGDVSPASVGMQLLVVFEAVLGVLNFGLLSASFYQFLTKGSA